MYGNAVHYADLPLNNINAPSPNSIIQRKLLLLLTADDVVPKDVAAVPKESVPVNGLVITGVLVELGVILTGITGVSDKFGVFVMPNVFEGV